MCGGDGEAWWWWYGGDYLHLWVRLVPQHLSRGQHLRNNIQGLLRSTQGSQFFLASLK